MRACVRACVCVFVSSGGLTCTNVFGQVRRLRSTYRSAILPDTPVTGAAVALGDRTSCGLGIFGFSLVSVSPVYDVAARSMERSLCSLISRDVCLLVAARV